MTRAAPVRAGESMMVTKRTCQRQFLLRPSKVTDQVILYVIGVKAQEYGISLHALTALSNHPHDVLTDHAGNIVEFTRDTHSNIAKALNGRFGRFENLWTTSKTNRLACVTPDALIDKMAYALANPVAAFLVMYGHQWPGIRMTWPMKPVTVARPSFYFRGPEKGGRWPDEVTITFERPPGLAHLSDEQLNARIKGETEAYEEVARATAKQKGIRFVGRRNVLRTSRYAHPTTREPRFRIAPLVAARDKMARTKRIAENQVWLQRYIRARDRFIDGEREVVFPYGTYRLVRHYGALCEPAPT